MEIFVGTGYGRRSFVTNGTSEVLRSFITHRSENIPNRNKKILREKKSLLPKLFDWLI